MNNKKSYETAFSLIEISMVVVIVSLLSIVAFSYLGQRSSFGYQESNTKLKQIKKHLLGFVKSHGYLPCPETATGSGNNGNANINTSGSPITSKCEVAQGFVPYNTLGLDMEDVKDGFGNRVSYKISVFSESSNLCNQAPNLDTTRVRYYCPSRGKQIKLHSLPLDTSSLVGMSDVHPQNEHVKVECKGNVSYCNGATYLGRDLVLALIAYNSIDGDKQVKQTPCTSLNGTSSSYKNCYGMFTRGSSRSSNVSSLQVLNLEQLSDNFDDQIIGISANEFKNSMFLKK